MRCGDVSGCVHRISLLPSLPPNFFFQKKISTNSGGAEQVRCPDVSGCANGVDRGPRSPPPRALQLFCGCLPCFCHWYVFFFAFVSPFFLYSTPSSSSCTTARVWGSPMLLPLVSFLLPFFLVFMWCLLCGFLLVFGDRFWLIYIYIYIIYIYNIYIYIYMIYIYIYIYIYI